MPEKKPDEKPVDIYTALLAAQAEMPVTVAKKSDNPHFKSKYADLADVVSAVAKYLNKHGIVYSHAIVPGDPFPMMRTELLHAASGTSIHCDVPLIVERQNMQGFKSATTYAKRIGFESVTGVAPCDDDDGNAAAQAAPEPQAKSAYSLKGHGKAGTGKNDWNRVLEQLSNELLDISEAKHTRETLVELRDAYRSEGKQAGWPKAWLDCLDEEFTKLAEEWGVTKPQNLMMAG